MAIVGNKKSVMILYSGPVDILSHRVRIVLAEKGIIAECIDAYANDKREDLLELNPYGTPPTLVDRDLVLYESNIIMEYLDERFPHPPLMPVYPVARAKTRLMMYRLDREWSPLIHKIEHGKPSESTAAGKQLAISLTKLAPAFAGNAYFLNEEFSLIDCCLAPILWRLPSWGITLSNDAKTILKYSDRVFARDTFRMSLTEQEQDLRKTEKAEIA